MATCRNMWIKDRHPVDFYIQITKDDGVNEYSVKLKVENPQHHRATASARLHLFRTMDDSKVGR